jgi:hypothetical protein
MSGYLTFPNGLELLSKWQNGDAEAKQILHSLFDDTFAGKFDADFAAPAPTNRVHVTGSVHMMALGLMHDLYGVNSEQFYKSGPVRYARANLLTARLLGIEKFYTVWALYAFSCEALGQKMMYPDKYPPGCDPDQVLVTRDNWQSIKAPDFNSGVPRVITGILKATQDITGMPPLLQISAPYSLAADIYGQEPLLADVVHDPEFVNVFLDHLADQVIIPWIEHFLSVFPDGWIELSDASGSPFFIGPENCITMAIRSMDRLKQGKPWAGRLFDANYRGDYVTQARKRNRATRRRGASGAQTGISLQHLTEIKHGVCPEFIIRLEADQVPVEFYRDQAIEYDVPLTLGIGSTQVDRNSVGDIDAALAAIETTAREYVQAVKTVCETVSVSPDEHIHLPWPSHIYFEDISPQSQFDMIGVIIRTVRDQGVFGPGAG